MSERSLMGRSPTEGAPDERTPSRASRAPDRAAELAARLRSADINLETFLREAPAAGVDREGAARMARAARSWPLAGGDRGEPRRGGTLRVGLWTPPEGLDPATNTYRTSRLVTEFLYSTLTALDADGRPYPDLASWIEVSDDGCTYTFGIRSGVRFHDGTPLRPDDVAFSLNRLIELGPAYHFDPWAATMAGADVDDAGAVRLRLIQPTAPILTWLAFCGAGIVPRAAIEGGRDLVTDPIGSGPFRLESRADAEPLRLVHHAEGDTDAPLDAIEFHTIRDDADRAAALLDGRIDLDALLGAAQWGRVAASPEHRALATADGRWHWLLVNCADALLADVGVRRAIAVGLDRAAIARDLFGPRATPLLGGVVASWSWAAAPDLSAYRLEGDRRLARTLLRASGVPEGTPIRVAAPEGLPIACREAELVAGQLNAIGLDASVDIVAPAGWGETVTRGGSFQLAVMYWGSPINDPDDFLYMGVKSGARYDLGTCGTAAIDELLEAGRAALDQEERAQAYRRLQAEMLDQLPVIPTIQPDVLRGVTARLCGFAPLRNAQLRSLREAWLDPG